MTGKVGKHQANIKEDSAQVKNSMPDSKYGAEFYDRQDKELSYEKALEETRKRLFSDGL